MQRTICSGCGASVETGEKANIHKVELIVHSHDQREWARKNDATYTEDLCDNCIGGILHKYFGVSAHGSLELPAFMH